MLTDLEVRRLSCCLVAAKTSISGKADKRMLDKTDTRGTLGRIGVPNGERVDLRPKCAVVTSSLS